MWIPTLTILKTMQKFGGDEAHELKTSPLIATVMCSNGSRLTVGNSCVAERSQKSGHRL